MRVNDLFKKIYTFVRLLARSAQHRSIGILIVIVIVVVTVHGRR
jgi:hypothetical protein